MQAEIVYRALARIRCSNPDLAAGRDLRDDLLDRIVMTVFLEGREPLRNAAAFDARMASERGGMGLPAQEISRAVQSTLERLARIQAALPKATPAAAADIRAQLAWLVPAGFLLTTPWERLREFPRYLQAIEQRLEKLGSTSGATRSSRPRSSRSKSATASASGPSAACGRPVSDEFRWLLEEFRVSLFAQQLKTRVPVSARRLEDAWTERERAPLV